MKIMSSICSDLIRHGPLGCGVIKIRFDNLNKYANIMV